MFRVRTMAPKDFSFAVSLANTMNWNMTAADFEFNRQLEPTGCLILEEDSGPIGLATCISYGQVGWFGNLVVDEAHRKLGAGSQLVKHSVSYLKTRGVTTVGLYAYPHLVEFYGRIGFRGDVDFVVLKANAISANFGASENLKIVDAQDLPLITDFDSSCFGSPRKRLLEAIFTSPGNIGYVAVDGSRIEGFVVAKVFGEVAEIGPLACPRSKPKIAVDLLKAVLIRLYGFEAYMYLPANEISLLEIALNAGFTEKFRLKRMFLGPDVAKNCIYSAESLERG